MTDQSSFLGTDEVALVPPTSDEKTTAILSHILCIVVGFIAPLVIYLVKKDESAFVKAHAKESLNFQLTVLIAYIVSIVLMVILIGILLIWLVMVASLVLVIMATVKASEGKLYKYPFSIKFIK
ncbi:MAG: DUF4870 domain-containing protein [Flavitalea sp.]